MFNSYIAKREYIKACDEIYQMQPWHEFSNLFANTLIEVIIIIKKKPEDEKLTWYNTDKILCRSFNQQVIYLFIQISSRLP